MYPDMQSVHTVSLEQWVHVIGQGWQSPEPCIAYIEGGQPQADDDSTVAVVSKLEKQEGHWKLFWALVQQLSVHNCGQRICDDVRDSSRSSSTAAIYLISINLYFH